MSNFGFSVDTSRVIKELPIMFGIDGFRIKIDEKGKPLINADRATLAKYISRVSEEGEPIEYSGEAELKSGYVKTIADGGIELTEEAPHKCRYCNVSFVLESIDKHKITRKVEGRGVDTMENIVEILSFRWYDAPRVKKDGTKYEFLNTYGDTTWMPNIKDEPSIKSFTNTDAAKVRHAYTTKSTLGLSEFIDFLYAYAMQPKGKVDILSNIDFNAMFKGDFSSLIRMSMFIHKTFVHKDKPTYGVKALMLVENNDGTNSMDRQSWYTTFEQLCSDAKQGTINDTFKYIQARVDKDSKPNKADNSMKYTPAGKGWFIGQGNRITWGLKQFKPEYMKDLKAEFSNKFGGQIGRFVPPSGAMPPMPQVGNFPPNMGGMGGGMPPMPPTAEDAPF